MKSENDEAPEVAIAAAISSAEELTDEDNQQVNADKPRVLIDHLNPDRTVEGLRDVLASSGVLYERGAPSRLFFDPLKKCTASQRLNSDRLIVEAHRICRPFRRNNCKNSDTYETDVKLTPDIAKMYLSMAGEWGLPVLNGISSAPIVYDDGSIKYGSGYDPESGIWCENVPDLTELIPDQPTDEEALSALHLLRDTFKTFCFADAPVTHDAALGLPVVDLNTPPGRDESAFLNSLITAVVRASLPTSPGILVKSAANSGSGSGKGLLVRCICLVAFGRQPSAVTAGKKGDEFEKRLTAELISGDAVVFFDNLNERELRSDLLASALTERPSRVRILGKTEMAPVNSSALIVLNGNGLSVAEDLARRFIAIEFDARTENPEAREFPFDIQSEVARRRAELLAAALTIWRWGRQHSYLPKGLPLGSFDDWSRWVRDPLLALGCEDPVKRVQETKALDTHRESIKELFETWLRFHGTKAVPLSHLHDEVLGRLDPHQRGRQYCAAKLKSLSGTRIAGLMLTMQGPTGTWGKTTYALRETAEHTTHRDHRGHEIADQISCSPGDAEASQRPQDPAKEDKERVVPMPPMPPMPFKDDAQSTGSQLDRPKFKIRI